ncbi:MAG: hypothetical protein PVS3B2_08210 [Candidatus Dormibacteraceae bacterium]
MSQLLPPAPPGQPTPPVKRDALARFRGRQWWELLLIFLPITLVIGGALGGATGFAALAVNLWIAKKSLSAATKVFAMIGVVLASYLIFFILATVLYVAIHRGQ